MQICTDSLSSQAQLITFVILSRSSEQDKDLEIIVLRQQLAILQRKQDKPIKPNRAEKMMLAVVTTKLKDVTQRPANRLRDIIRIFQPETVLAWLATFPVHQDSR